MGCGSCSSGGCGSLPGGCRNNGACGTGGCNKLNVFDWLAGMEFPAGASGFNIIEVRFKNTRKDFFKVNEGEEYHTGDIVAVEAATGHDIGIVSLSGEHVKVQMKKRGVRLDNRDIKKVYRKARQADIDKWRDAQALEQETMIRARKISIELGLEMKISDVEYQGDKTKATFFYTADDRVDFRELIKLMADEFKVRVEMKQIGARQEASRLGGIGSCGRELCCSTWLTNFKSVNTTAARYQNLSINQTKLSGQCGRLKCCLNYELDTYLDALRGFPKEEASKKIKTKKGDAYLFKTDVLRGIMTYSFADSSTFYPLQLEDVKMLLDMNAKGLQPEDLTEFMIEEEDKEVEDFEDLVGQISLSELEKGSRKGKQKESRRPSSNQDRRPKNRPSKDRNRKDKPKENKPMMGLPENKLVVPEKSEQQPSNKPKNNRNKKRRKPNRGGGQNPTPPQS